MKRALRGLNTGEEGWMRTSAAPSQSDHAYEVIKQDILTCVIEPKRRLTEVELAERYDLGRASVRRALTRLSQEALVDVLPRYGYVVAGFDELDARDLFQLQLLLEPSAGRLAAGRVDAKQLIELDAQCAETQRFPGPEGAVKFLHANTNFHVAVASFSGNALMARFVRILFERLERFLHASGRIEEVGKRVAHTHEEVVRLLVEGRADEVEKAVRLQVSHNHQVIRDSLGFAR